MKKRIKEQSKIEKTKNKKLIISPENIPTVIFAFAFLAIMLTLFLNYMAVYKEISILDMRIRVGDYVGLNLEDRYLEFGTAIPGGSSARHIEIENDYGYLLFVEIEITEKKDLNYLLGKSNPIPEEWVALTDNHFILEKNAKKSVKFTINVPEDTEYGNYSAQAVIKFKYFKY